MLKLNRKPSPFLLFPLTLLLVFFLAFPWVSAKEAPKPKPQDWQINGILAALDDGHLEVQKLGFQKISEYELKDLDKRKAESIGEKAVKLLKDEKVDSSIRASAAEALGNLGEAGVKYAPLFAKILKDEKVDSGIRASAAEALGNLGEAGATFTPDILKFLKDEKVDKEIRASAAEALGNLGEVGAKFADDILKFLKDEKADSFVRASAARALGNLGEAGAKFADDILDFLKDEKANSFVRASAAEALGNLGEAGAKFTPDIAEIFKDEKVDSSIRASAAIALNNLGEAGAKFTPDILNFLKDEKVDSFIRVSAAQALGNSGEAGAKFVPDILNFMKDEKLDKYVSTSAARALGNLGEAGAKFTPDILNFLKDEKVDSSIRASAAEALDNLGEAGAKFTPDILNFLQDEKVDSFIRVSAARALDNLGEAGAKFAPDIAKILKDEKVDSNIRVSAARALGNLGEAGAKFTPDIAKIFKDEKVDKYVRAETAKALGKIRQLELKEVATTLNIIYERNQFKVEEWRFYTYFLGGGTEEVKTLLTWLGKPERKSIPEKLTRDKALKTLEVFSKIWQPSQDLSGLREDLAEQISIVASQKQVTWQVQDILLLEGLKNNLKNAGYANKASALESEINNLQFWGKIYSARNIILLHIAFWLTLIFFYPKSPQIQAIFFWNPWVRRILGMGYVGFILTWVPFFRRKLLEPFKFPLLADAGLDNFKPNGYFPESNITDTPDVETLNLTSPNPTSPPANTVAGAVTQIIPQIKGQIIIQGASGLGKTMFLRHLLKKSSQTVVYLPAQKCQNGVIEAIQAKLHGQAQDKDFLRSLIYSGAIDICIDGINEVNAETRAKICQFVESNFHGNIIMTTQPLEWIPPATAKVYYIQPLTSDQIEKFLLSRVSRLPKEAPIQGKDYETACKNFLNTIFSNLSNEENIATNRILSNPMDLSLVSLLLSQKKEPNLFSLQQQQYNLMSGEYKHERGYEFPLKKFSQAVYQMRLNDEVALPANEFFKELESMEDEKYKMVVSRQWKQDDEDKIGHEVNKNMKEWYFRHDKIMDFFLVQNFLGTSDEIEARLIDHMGDSRFRGVYFLLANLLPLDEAKELREKLIQYAADTKDHNVSDTFVQLLRTR